MNFSWPWNSLRKAYVSWQGLESRRLTARQELERRYLDLRQVAESLHLDPNQGLLRAARLALDQPLDPLVLKAHTRLHQDFAFLGKSFWRQAPAALQMELRRYAGHLEALCRKYEEMAARLVSAQEIIDILQRNPALGTTENFRLALISPEAEWLLYQLREKRLVERQARDDCLVRGWRTRLATCRKWLGLLQDSMPPSAFRKLNRSLNDLAGKAAGAEGQEAPKLLADHAKLDLLIAVANRQATRTIADLLPRKSN